MKICIFKSQPAAFTRSELFVVVSIIAVLISLLLPNLAKSRVKTKAIKCSSNLKQIALAATMFASDNDGFYPFGATNSFAYQDTNAVWRHFLVMSNELGSTKILVCRSDSERTASEAVTFGDYRASDLSSLEKQKNTAVSYFMALRPKKEEAVRSQGILSGDRNIFVTSKKLDGPRLNLGTNDLLRWTTNLHGNSGNIAYMDGSVRTYLDSREEVPPQSEAVDLLLPIVP